MPLPIEETLAILANSEQPLVYSKLAELSSLNSEELELFKRSWTIIKPERRRQIVHRLVALAEDNLELNFDSIFKFCLKDQDAEVRSKAIEGLWENEEASLISPLTNLLEQDSSEIVQAAAATALGKFATLAEHNKLRSCHVARIQEALLAVSGDKSKPVEVRHRAVEAIAPLSLPQVTTAIMDTYQSDNAKLRVSAIYAMGKNGDPCWLPILLKELASADTEVRYEAVGACGELEAEEAVPGLIKLVNDPDMDVRMATIQALAKIGNAQARECLQRCLKSSTEAVRQTAEQALSELGTREAPIPFPKGTAWQ